MEKLTAKDIMNRDVLTVNSDLSVEGLAEFLFHHSISGAPVISRDGKMIGIVSITDIISHESQPEKGPQFNSQQDYYVHMAENRFSHQDLDGFHFTGEATVTVQDIMTPKILEVGEDDTVRQVADIMIRNRIHRVFVTRNKKPIGIISTTDMLKIIRDM